MTGSEGFREVGGAGAQGTCTNPSELVLIDARDGTFIQAVSPYP